MGGGFRQLDRGLEDLNRGFGVLEPVGVWEINRGNGELDSGRGDSTGVLGDLTRVLGTGKGGPGT